MSASGVRASGAQDFARVLALLEDGLDWGLLGREACEGDGSSFYEPELRARALDTGLMLFDTIAGCLPEQGPGRSLYVGASVAELAPMLAETLVLGREVHWVELESAGTLELDRAMAEVAARVGLALPRPRTCPLEELDVEPCEHLWLASVLTDPEAFPALHDELYERGGGPQATGRGDLSEERQRAGRLLDALLERSAAEALLTTSDEERSLIAPRVEQRGWRLDVPETSIVSAVVGDALRVCRLTR